MKKVLAILMTEFRKLGAKIIFANFYKVIIDTGKLDLSAAKAYCDSLLKTLQTRLVLDISSELFSRFLCQVMFS